MDDIRIDAPAGTIDGAFEKPDGEGPWPGVVVVHDLLGLSTDARNITRRFADAGFLAVAPDLYARGGKVRCVQRVMREMLMRRGNAVDDILAARDALTARPDCSGKVGVVGFCLGGGFALLMSPKGFGAAAPFYPSIPPLYDSVVTGGCAIVASYGKRDPLNPGNAGRLRTVLERKGIEHDIKVYANAGHSFANDVPVQPVARIVGFGYDAEATEDAFARTFAFFHKHLAEN
ncbi:dienelactone hydrolase family protein [Hoyosella subflava]|uniref:Dienelactone hydrolase domain-containing protein n=1 Tax=Hoyosella subflava (strain DSM 45089 / JCM 17490 / NBRC 109087 / DQS3-9A1) TaxID=443218 RepID=F6EKQ2_HOYSD|nr:dienelactone hydrolase family protein [Hoyosella subflava]AEF40188.1 hypothetical protein AS9A_1739 [Hoyosella subflava DQS3-9A1]